MCTSESTLLNYLWSILLLSTSIALELIACPLFATVNHSNKYISEVVGVAMLSTGGG